MSRIVGTPIIEHSGDERVAAVTVRTITEGRAKVAAKNWLKVNHGVENPETEVSGGIAFQTVLMRWTE